MGLPTSPNPPWAVAAAHCGPKPHVLRCIFFNPAPLSSSLTENNLVSAPLPADHLHLTLVNIVQDVPACRSSSARRGARCRRSRVLVYYTFHCPADRNSPAAPAAAFTITEARTDNWPRWLRARVLEQRLLASHSRHHPLRNSRAMPPRVDDIQALAASRRDQTIGGCPPPLQISPRPGDEPIRNNLTG